MKFRSVFFLSVLIIIAGQFIWAYEMEGGDMNVVLLYLLVFFIPSCFVTVINASLLEFLKRSNIRSIAKWLLSVVPVLVLTILSMNKIKISIVDGDLRFVAIPGIAALAITNLVWKVGAWALLLEINR